MAGLTVEYDRKDIDPKKAGDAPPRLEHITRSGVLAFDSSYPTGGESLTATMLQLDEVYFLRAVSMSGYVFGYDYANSKLIAYYADENALADGALIQVPNTTNLAALSAVHFLVVGRVASY